MPDEKATNGKSNQVGYGKLYYKWCMAINKLLSKSPQKLEKLEKQKRKRHKKAEENYERVLLEFREMEQKYSEEDKKLRTCEKKLRLAERSKNKAEKIYKQEAFNKALDFLGMDLTLEDVMAFSGFLALMSLVLAFIIVIPLFIFLNLDRGSSEFFP